MDILQNEKDINVLCGMNIKDLKSEGEKESAIAFLEKMIEQKPEILILDQIILREAASLDLERILGYRKALPDMKTLIIGEHYNEENVRVMMQGGARGFFKLEQDNQDDGQLIKCIHVVAQGEYWLEAKLTTRFIDENNEESKKKKDLLKSLSDLSKAKIEMLTRREMEILALISESMTNEEIAQKLFLSTKTVKTHVRNIFEKTNIRSRVEAALMYTRHELLSRAT